MKYEFQEDEFWQKFDEAPVACISKGENKDFIRATIEATGRTMPEFAGRCLHEPNSQ